ncbi:MAG: hypothetical protein V4574_12325 [Pseudomonadota bacterium]
MRVFLMVAASLLAVPAAAQEHPATQAAPAGDEDIIVRGDKDRNAATRGYVRDLVVLNGTDPIARFDKTVLCPGVAGLNAAMSAAITARMRRVAEAANIPLAEPGCRTNALVIIAPDKAEVITELRRHHPGYFRDGTGEMVVIPKQTGPTTAWHLGGYIDRTGQPASYDGDTRIWTVTTSITPSRLSATVRPVFFASVVVIEREAVIGLTTTQVADYAAMRTFAGVDPARLTHTSAPTILTVIDAAPDALVSPTLTQWDLAYLRALYAIPAQHYGQRQRTEIRRRMIDELDKADPDPAGS